MNATIGTQVMGSVVIALAFTNVVSGGGQLFVTYEVGLIQRFDSQTFELLGELPGTENFCCAVEIDPYRQYLWRQSSNIYDFDGNFVSTGGGGVTLLSIFEPISNSFWDLGVNVLTRETYDRINVSTRWEVELPPHHFPTLERNIAGSEDNVFFSLDKTIYSLNGPIAELPFTTFQINIQTVKDEFLYFAYRPSTTA